MRPSWILVPVLLTAGLAPVASAVTNPAIRGDFNGDGHPDLAVGVPNEAIGTLANAGAVNVRYGTANGYRATGGQLWHQDSAGVLGGAEAGDRFGSTVASGDFDGDGYADLAIGAPYEDTSCCNQSHDMGVTHVLYGSPSGLTATGDQVFFGGEGLTVGSAHGGAALAVGDFDDDGKDDLAIGTPGGAPTGNVTVHYGSADGLGPLHGFSAPHSDEPLDDRFGAALAAGDFDGNGVEDLAVGAPYRDDLTGGSVFNAGTVYVYFGTAGDGLATAGSATIDQDSAGVADVPEEYDLFGAALAAGDFDGDGKDDLAIGVPGERGGTGAIHVLDGSVTGPTGTGSAFLYRYGGGLPGPAQAGTGLGSVLAAGNVEFADEAAELVIGAPRDDVPRAADAGSVTVVYNGPAQPFYWYQHQPFIAGIEEEGDRFGHSVAVSARGDVLIGVPGEDFSGKTNAGAVHALWFGTDSRGLLLTQDTTGVPGAAESGDWFGGAVS